MRDLKPVILSDEALSMLMAMAQPLPVEERGRFLEMLAAQLQAREFGDGRIFRVASEAQKHFLQPENFDHAKSGKYV